jgi:4-carboxymuconolactone decarboxylase
LTTKHATSDPAFDLAKKLLDEQQVVDLTRVAGTYIGVAMILAMEQEGLNLLTASRGAEQWHEGK